MPNGVDLSNNELIRPRRPCVGGPMTGKLLGRPQPRKYHISRSGSPPASRIGKCVRLCVVLTCHRTRQELRHCESESLGDFRYTKIGLVPRMVLT